MDENKLTKEDRAFNMKLSSIGGNTTDFISIETLQRNIEVLHTDPDFKNLSDELEGLYDSWNLVFKEYAAKARLIRDRANLIISRSNK